MFRSPTKQTIAGTVRVVSYNVLSPHLATTSSYPTLNPDHLDPSKRFELVLQKIEQAISHQGVIVCLQEVCYDWAGSLHTFFANRGYHMVTGLYGRPFNGYMGVAMAWPTSSFETLNVDISRLSDTREDGWPREDPEDEEEANAAKQSTFFSVKPCFSMFSWLLPRKKSDEKPPLQDEDPWAYSKRRFNVLLTVTLRDKETGNKFCVGNYHMPCAFWSPPVMTLHCDLAARRVQKIAQEQLSDNTDNTTSLPYVIAGDWNIKPQDPAYQLLTTGILSPDDPGYPPPAMSKYNKDKTLMIWEPTVQPMRSAYATCHGREPDFTNFAAPRSTEEVDEGFIDTLDYIFISPEWKVVSTPEHPSREGVKGPFPNLDVREPSDHILISAKLQLDSM